MTVPPSKKEDRAGTGAAAAPALAAASRPRGAGHWTEVRRGFTRNRWAMAGALALALLGGAAVLAPFLAGARPILLLEGGTLSFPVLDGLTVEDFLWLCAAALPIAAWIGAALSRRRALREGRTPALARAAWAAAGLFALAAAGGAVLWPEHLDSADFGAVREESKNAEFRLMPPIPYSPFEISLRDKLRPPSAGHLLGTDPVGRDVASRLVHGTRVSLVVGFLATAVCVLIGLLLGAPAGYFGGWIDLLLSRVIEVVICFPAFFVFLAVLCFLPPSTLWIILLIGIFRWPETARLARGEFLRLKGEEFVVAGRALGVSHTKLILKHMLPNSLASVIVAAALGVATAILLESGMSFLGLGVQPPTPSWGGILSDGKTYFERAWWMAVFPGAAIFLAVTAINLVGEGLRDALDPKMRT